MPTPKELRAQATECLELANRTTEFFAKEALRELAQELNRKARQAERHERDSRAKAASVGGR
jgi:F0F1-type ATP synthase membrane subunit b/b'